MRITSMADVFISYAREDREMAHKLAQVLEGFGWSVWWDMRLMAGEIWDEMIEREIEATRSVVVLWSPESVKNRWVRKEARYGDVRRMMFPALIETVDIPLEFSDVHAEDLCGWTGDSSHEGLRDLVDALAILLDEPARGQPKQAAQAKKHPKSRAKLTAKKSYTPEELPDLSVFRDVDEPWCPEKVALPVGHFMMGAPDTDEDADNVEKPRHKVAIVYRLAVGRYPVTFEEYGRFCDAVGRDKPESEDGDRGRWPVINVNWDDAKAYSAWLSAISGKAYRLLSEAEWEYACRAGTETRYSCGDSITEKDANFGANRVSTSLS